MWHSSRANPLGFVYHNFSQISGFSTWKERGSTNLQLHKEPSIMISFFHVPYAICDLLPFPIATYFNFPYGGVR